MIIKLPNYIIKTSHRIIENGDYFYDSDGEICRYTDDYQTDPNEWVDNLKIVSHKPLNGFEELEDVDLLTVEADLYSEIENLIITWNIDGTKTAGYLTRQIMELIQTINNE
jgi:hypothetical protein